MLLHKWKLVKLVQYTEEKQSHHPPPSKLGDLMYTRQVDPVFPNREYWKYDGQVEVDTATLTYHASISQSWWAIKSEVEKAVEDYHAS